MIVIGIIGFFLILILAPTLFLRPLQAFLPLQFPDRIRLPRYSAITNVVIPPD